MDMKINRNLRNVWAFLLLFTVFTLLGGCSPAPRESGKQQQTENQYSKEKIQEQLAANKATNSMIMGKAGDRWKSINWAPKKVSTSGEPKTISTG